MSARDFNINIVINVTNKKCDLHRYSILNMFNVREIRTRRQARFSTHHDVTVIYLLNEDVWNAMTHVACNFLSYNVLIEISRDGNMTELETASKLQLKIAAVHAALCFEYYLCSGKKILLLVAQGLIRLGENYSSTRCRSGQGS